MENPSTTLGGGEVKDLTAAPGRSPADYLVRVGDGSNLWNSRKYNVWGCDSLTSVAKGFLRNVRAGDRLWFVQNKSGGRLIGVATFKYQSPRLQGPLLSVWTDEELGWTGSGGWDTLIHYTDFYDLRACSDLLTGMKYQGGFLSYTPTHCSVNLPQMYPFVVLLAGARKLE
jgi:hypothetical protein